MSESPTSPLEPLPHRVFFVFKEEDRWPELFGGGEPPPVESCVERFMGAKNSWVVQTYIQLRRRGLDVELVSRYIPGEICVTSYEHLQISDVPFNSYVVACRHDRGRPEICEQRIVQNQLNVVDGTDHYMPHWPQPAIKPRDPERGTEVRSVVYHGRPSHLAPAFRTTTFRDELATLGMALVMGEVDATVERAEWTDYRSADVVLAARDATPYLLSLKPPSKLLNSWIAGCPALLGPEPAYQQLRRSELDFIEVRSPEDAIAALLRLRNDAGLYEAMVRNGFERAAEYTPDRMVQRWRDLLAGPIAQGYDDWLAASSVERRLGRPAKFIWRSVKHRRQRRRYLEEREGG